MKDWFNNNDSCKYILTLGIKLYLIPYTQMLTQEKGQERKIYIFFGGEGEEEEEGGRTLTS